MDKTAFGKAVLLCKKRTILKVVLLFIILTQNDFVD